jgi:hypothetical protein
VIVLQTKVTLNAFLTIEKYALKPGTLSKTLVFISLETACVVSVLHSTGVTVLPNHM